MGITDQDNTFIKINNKANRKESVIKPQKSIDRLAKIKKILGPFHMTSTSNHNSGMINDLKM